MSAVCTSIRIEKGIKANWIVMDDVDVELSKPIGWVESRFAHGAIALIKQSLN